MVLKLDPRLPLLWRSPTAVQLGVDPAAVRIESVTELQERMLAALVVGVSAPGLTMLSGGRTAERDELLQLVEPALLRDSGREMSSVAVTGEGALAEAIASVLAGSGIHVLASARAADVADSGADVAVAVGDYVLAPELHGVWLRRDVPHLPVVLTDNAVTVGPMVEPGSGACLLCLELHRRDEDAAWPALATQLLGRRSRAASAALVAEAAAAASRAVLDRLARGTSDPDSIRIDGASGERALRRWEAHPDCGCRGIPAAAVPVRSSRRGTGWASAARIAPAAGSPPT